MVFDRPHNAVGSDGPCSMHGEHRFVAGAEDAAAAGLPMRHDELRRRQAEAELRLSRLTEMAPGAFYTCLQTPDGKLRHPYVSQRYTELTGLQPQDVADDVSAMLSRIHPEDVRQHMKTIAQAYRSLSPWRNEFRLRHPARGEIWLEARATPERRADGSVVWYGFMHDISERKRADAVMQAREREFRTLVEQSPDYIVRYNRRGERLYVNPRLQRLAGDALPLGRTPLQGSIVADRKRLRRMIEDVFACGEPRSAELRACLPDGGTLWLDVRVCAELNEEGGVESVFAIGRDINESVALRERIRAQALTDPLTQLSNRQALYERGPVLLREAAVGRRRLGVIILDLDRFKEVNDTMGHGAGDRLLREVSQRIAECVREHDLLVRMGGDEFAALVTNVGDDAEVAFVATRICEALALPFQVDGRPLVITSSIGIAVFPDDGVDLEHLLSNADGAMYQAKRAGRNRFEFHCPAFIERAQRRLDLEEALREATEGEGFELCFQPLVRLDDGALVGAEALLHWRHPRLGTIPPEEFIPVAEETGLIMPVGRWVMQVAAEAAVRWNRGRATPLRLAVNVSTRQFSSEDLALVVRETLQRTGCEGRWLALEITESLLLEDDEHVRRTLRALADLGVKVAIDDFGTGYSALSYLTRFEVDCLKIDRQFVRGLERDGRQRELLKAVVAIARGLDMELVAEGVESGEQARILAEHGCRLAQGHLFGKPVPAGAFEAEWLSASPKRAGLLRRCRPFVRAISSLATSKDRRRR